MSKVWDILVHYLDAEELTADWTHRMAEELEALQAEHAALQEANRQGDNQLQLALEREVTLKEANAALQQRVAALEEFGQDRAHRAAELAEQVAAVTRERDEARRVAKAQRETIEAISEAMRGFIPAWAREHVAAGSTLAASVKDLREEHTTAEQQRAALAAAVLRYANDGGRMYHLSGYPMRPLVTCVTCRVSTPQEIEPMAHKADCPVALARAGQKEDS